MLTHSDLMEKLSQLENDLEQTQHYIRERLKKSNNHTANEGTVFGYFSHSVVMDYEQDASRLIIGNFHVKNVSSNPVVSPTILLKITTEDEFQFLGKYTLPNQTQQMYSFEWERIELKNFDPVTHYYLRPIQSNAILPNEQLSFQNFQIIIPFGATVNVDGFVYYEGKEEGIAAINYINISG